MDRWTVRSALLWMQRDFQSRGIDSPRLDGELLLAEVLGTDRVGVYLHFDRPLSTDERERLRALVQRRRRREPVAYILGRKEFFGRVFLVSPEVLVPRPESELLVEIALERFAQEGEDPGAARGARLLDMGTGSGALALTLALELPQTRVDAVDSSAEALAVARRNLQRLAPEVPGTEDRVVLRQGNLWEAVDETTRYDAVVANLPYIAEDALASLAPEVGCFEPRAALQAGSDGLGLYRDFFASLWWRLQPGAWVAVEHDDGQGDAIAALAQKSWQCRSAEALAGLTAMQVQSRNDLAGRRRCVVCQLVATPG